LVISDSSAARSGSDAEQAVQSVAPPSLGSRRFIARWAVVILTIVLGAAASFTVQAPIYVFGTGVVVAAGDATSDAVRLTVFLPPDDFIRVGTGQEILVRTGTGVVKRRVLAVERGLVSPDEARVRYRLGAAASGVVTEPARVVLAEFGPTPAGSQPRDYLGAVYQVSVAVGKRRPLLAMVRGLFNAAPVR